MKKIVLLLILPVTFVFVRSACAQTGQWEWLRGDSTTLGVGSLGTQGIASLTNDPSALYEPCEWTDLNGNYWMYGGFLQGTGTYNDLWKYDPIANEWTWMTGTHTIYDAGIFGTKGVSLPTNRPPSLTFGTASWTDLNGNFWMFGGCGNNQYYNALWEYNISTNEWTWMKGSNLAGQPGVYGTLGVPDTANTPGSRDECASTWTDDAGDLFFFGGQAGVDISYNDLWRYTISTNTWTWMKGSQLINQPATYGTLGIEDSSNTPGARWAQTRWKDASGNFWMFGGYDLTTLGFYNDLWRFNPVTNNWTWMSGSNTENALSNYGTKGVTTPSNMPGARVETRAAWTDTIGNLWFFGGWGYATSQGFLNDLWMYSMGTKQWTWVSNDSTVFPTGLWGTKGISTPFTKPNARFGAVGWTDHKGHLYFFGGQAGPYNDVWEYTIDMLLPPPVAAFQSSNTVLCANDCINFTDLSTNATSWQWSFPGASPSTSVVENPQNICYQVSGNYDVTLIASGNGTHDTIKINSYINVDASPLTPVITQSHDTLFCNVDTNYTSYQWYDSSAIIPGATAFFYVINNNGNYNMQVTNKNGCKSAAGINIALGVPSFNDKGMQGAEFIVYPNPSSGQFIISFDKMIYKAIAKIYNPLGEEVYSEEINGSQQTINCKLSSGIYFMRVIDGDNIYIRKIFIE